MLLNREQTMLIFKLFLGWWPWKLGQGHQNLIKPLYYPNDKFIKFGQNPSFLKIWYSKNLCDLENVVKVTKIYSPLSPLPKVFLCQFGQYVNMDSGGSVQRKLNLYSLNLVVTLKVRSRSPKILLTLICDCPNDNSTWSLVWIHYLIRVIGCRKAASGKYLTFKVMIWPWKWGQGHQN